MDTIRPRKFEFAVLVVIIGILAVVVMNALEKVREDFEEAAVQSEAAAIRVELLDWLAHREAVGGTLPESRNPIRWIARLPQGYLGELETAPKERGVWYFDTRRQELVYRFRFDREARFRLVRGREAVSAAGSFAGVGLNRVEIVSENVK